MADAKTEEIERWMTKAHHDLDAAEYLLQRNPPLTDVSVYHCQQAAEKALFRYPTGQPDPSPAEARQAFAMVHMLVDFVANQLPHQMERK
jgi:hypothetical protein